MEIGCCFYLEQLDNFAKTDGLGLDFLELPLYQFSQLSDKEIKNTIEKIQSIPVPCLATNILFPSGLKVVGEQVDYSAISAYLNKIFEKTAALPYKTVVFGSGGARTIPEGFPKEKAFDQLVRLCKEYLIPIAQTFDLTFAVEAINPLECNFINTTAEAFELVNLINHPRMKLLLDFYHMEMAKEDLSKILSYEGFIEHVHIASAKNGRDYPKENDGEDYQALFALLKQSKYKNGLMSMECKKAPDPISSISNAVSLLKKQDSLQ